MAGGLLCSTLILSSKELSDNIEDDDNSGGSNSVTRPILLVNSDGEYPPTE